MGFYIYIYIHIYISLLLNFSVKFVAGFSGLLGSHLYPSKLLEDLQLLGGMHFGPIVTSKSLSIITEILINAEQVLYPENRGNTGWNSMEVTAVI